MKKITVILLAISVSAIATVCLASEYDIDKETLSEICCGDLCGNS